MSPIRFPCPSGVERQLEPGSPPLPPRRRTDRIAHRAARIGAAVALIAGSVVAVTGTASADGTTPATGARLATSGTPSATNGGAVYYLDAVSGSDSATGRSAGTAWRTLGRITSATLVAGDVVALRRGQTFSGSATIAESGTSSNPIRIAAHGTGSPPTLTNPGRLNMLQLGGDHIAVSLLRFSDGAVFDNSDGQGIVGDKYRLSGAIAVTTGADNVSVVDNEFTGVGVGVKTYGLSTRIEHNYFHDLVIAYRGPDSGSETSYGALGISLNNDSATVAYNDFINCRSTNSPYGADGGAIEIEGFDHTKNNISIHHNHSRGSQGFLEVTESSSSNVTLSYNLSDDYQQFIAWDTTTEPAGYLAVHNTVIRTRDDSHLFDIYYYRETGPAPTDAWITVRNNIFYVTGSTVFSGYDYPHDHNVFAGMSEPVGYPLGVGDLITDPRFLDQSNADYHLQATSPAVDNGTSASGSTDLDGATVPVGQGRDAGAFEYGGYSAGGSNLLADPGFESQTSIGGGTSPWFTEGASSAGVDVDAGKARRGQDNAWLAAGFSDSWGALKQNVAVVANTDYRFTVWVRNSGGFDYGYLGAKTSGYAVINEVRHGDMSSGYNRVIVTFNSGSNTTVVRHVGFYGSNGWQQIDDASLVAT